MHDIDLLVPREEASERHASSVPATIEIIEQGQAPEQCQTQGLAQGPAPSGWQGPAPDNWQAQKIAQDRHAAPERCLKAPQQCGPPLSDLEEHTSPCYNSVSASSGCRSLRRVNWCFLNEYWSQALQQCQLRLQEPAMATAPATPIAPAIAAAPAWSPPL